jgi:phosphoribosylformylglycinamidine synthase
MSAGDLSFCRDYFRGIGRDPTLAELRVLDTYWSDHCRHTTFTTALNEISIAEGGSAPALKRALALYDEARREVYGRTPSDQRPRTLMDLATIGTKVLKKRGLLADMDESKEINACSVRVQAEFRSVEKVTDTFSEPWLFLFKNETHNHPTEIEPFGGAATCLGGAIRDPLSGRAYVHQAMRVTGGADPRSGLAETLPGKLPQLKIAREAAAGYSSYGNQIGLATGQVSEFYHPGFLAKRMELGAVTGAVPEAWVRREEPAASSPTATATPPAPKSLQRLIRAVTAGLRKRRWSFRSSTAFPFCTSAPAVSTDSPVCTLEEPVAPPMPSRPVFPPTRSTMSPASGSSRRTQASGTAPATAPSSMRLARKPGW